jgi:hypothetical protein
MKDESNIQPEENEKEATGYPRESESTDLKEDGDSNYTEQNDVTGPEKRDFPSVGNAETDFASRPVTRRTGRMVGHEPGTEGL